MTMTAEALFDDAFDALLFTLHFDGVMFATSTLGRLAQGGCIGSGRGLCGQDALHARAILRGRLEALPKQFAAVLVAQHLKGEAWEIAIDEIRQFIASIPAIAEKVNGTLLSLAIRDAFGDKMQRGDMAAFAGVHINTVTRQYRLIEPETRRAKFDAWAVWAESVRDMVEYP